jgi:hypothetical protein
MKKEGKSKIIFGFSLLILGIVGLIPVINLLLKLTLDTSGLGLKIFLMGIIFLFHLYGGFIFLIFILNGILYLCLKNKSNGFITSSIILNIIALIVGLFVGILTLTCFMGAGLERAWCGMVPIIFNVPIIILLLIAFILELRGIFKK